MERIKGKIPDVEGERAWGKDRCDFRILLTLSHLGHKSHYLSRFQFLLKNAIRFFFGTALLAK